MRNAIALARGWSIALEAALLTLAVRRALRRLPLARPLTLNVRRVGSAPVDTRLAAAIVAIVSGRLLSQTCLVNAFVLAALLQRHGEAATVVIGTRRNAGGLAAHAWVEVAGVTWLEGRRGVYEPLCAVGVAS